jgi:sugar/nucleoside kinase (ribokinase family)
VLAAQVGAGDSFLAALLASLLINGEELPDALEVGCRCGAFVASCAGATPEHDAAVMASLEACVAGGPSQVEIGEP